MKIFIKNISKTFRLPKEKQLTVLKDINLSVAQGDFVVILGKTGCGKSTLLKIIAGLEFPDSGEIRIDSERIKGPHPSRAIVFQQPTLLPWLNVAENIGFGCKIRGDLQNLNPRIARFMDLMELSGFETCHPPELSVGMAHRVSLARAFIGKPDILLMDEPFSALDTLSRTRLQGELINIWHQENFTVVFVTHDLEEAVVLGNKIVLLGGEPTGIKEMCDIDLNYPRDITDHSFNQARTEILHHFKHCTKEPRLFGFQESSYE